MHQAGAMGSREIFIPSNRMFRLAVFFLCPSPLYTFFFSYFFNFFSPSVQLVIYLIISNYIMAVSALSPILQYHLLD